MSNLMQDVFRGISNNVVTNSNDGGTAGAVSRAASLAFLLNRLHESMNRDKDKGKRDKITVDPDPNHKVPVVYGEAFVEGKVTDAHPDATCDAMWFVVTICEQTGNTLAGDPSEIEFVEVYWDGKKVGLQGDAVTLSNLDDAEGNSITDWNGLIKFYPYSGGGDNPVGFVNYGPGNLADAYELVPGWTSTDTMNDLVFCLIYMEYTPDKNLRDLGNITFKIRNSMNQPGDVLYDYMTNTRYGAGIPAEDINQ